MDALSRLVGLPAAEAESRGLRHTPREIQQQPQTWLGTRERVLGRKAELRELLSRAGVGGATPPQVVLSGAGTSDYVCGTVAGMLADGWRAPVRALATTDLLTHHRTLLPEGGRYLFGSFSRSGNSPEAVAVEELLAERFPEAAHLIVTCNRDGRLARDWQGRPGACCLLLDEAVNDRGLAMTSSFSNLVLAGWCLAHLEELETCGGRVAALAEGVAGAMPAAADLAERLVGQGFAHASFLGSGALKAVAQESALKMVELTAGRVRTQFESFLGVRHGPLSAVHEDSLVVGLLSEDARVRPYELDLLEELRRKRLGRAVVAVRGDPRDDARLAGLADHVLALSPGVGEELQPIAAVVFGQLLGLFASLAGGLAPDAPSPTGAITRVVAGVRIHPWR